MPTILRIGPYRFFYSADCDEPAHIHVERDTHMPSSGSRPYAYRKVDAYAASHRGAPGGAYCPPCRRQPCFVDVC
jgi:hypothetical protein